MRRSIKKVAAGLLATMMIGTMLTGCGGGNKKDSGSSKKETSEINIGFSQVGAESDWRVANTKSMKSALTAKNGFKLSFADAQQKQENQTKAVREFITQGVDVIAIAPVTETGWETVLKEAKKADIPVITVDRQIKTSDDSLITAWVGSDFKKEGVKAAEWLIKEKGKETDEMLKFLQLSSGENVYLEYLFEADSYTDLIYRYAVVKQLTNYNSSLIDELEQLIKDLELKEKVKKSNFLELLGSIFSNIL